VASDGTRLGFGSGFYDATLPEFCPPALAVAAVYHFQLLGELPLEGHDVRCARIVTETQTLSPALA
jgi:5-formyltetrahydrofolate cyclo-ligase